MRTGQANLELSVSGGATVAVSITTPKLTIELGSGAMTSSSAGGFVLAAPGTLLNALGAVVVMSGAVTGHNGRIAVGSGSFTWINDLRSKTSPTLLDNNSTAADWGTGLGTLTSGVRSASGLTIIGSNINNQTVIYGGAVTIDGISTGAARELSNIEATSITVSGGSSSFTAGLTLRTSGAMILAANLTAGGAIALHANSLTLSSNTTTAGGAVTIDLGQTGVYSNGTGAGFTLATSGRDLTIHAGSISNLTATNAIFRLGTGILTVSGGLAIASRTRVASQPSYTGGYITSAADELKFSSPAVVYYFTSDTGGMLAEDQAAAQDSNGFWINGSALTAADLGFKSEGGTTDTYTSSGLNDGVTGDYLWRVPGVVISDPTNKTVFVLAENRAVHFYELANPTLPTVTPLWLSNSKSLSFDGGNIFNTGLTVASAGAITQSSGAFIVSGGNLVVTRSSAIILNGKDNLFDSLGALTSSGAISIASGTSTGLILSRDIIAGGAITLTATGLSLSANITSRGGAVALNLGSGVYSNGTGFSWTTTNQNLHLESRAAPAILGTAFIMGTGHFTASQTGAKAFEGKNIYIGNFASTAAQDRVRDDRA